jgi:hypothetical protein
MACMADGSVRAIGAQTISEATLRQLIDPHDGAPGRDF